MTELIAVVIRSLLAIMVGMTPADERPGVADQLSRIAGTVALRTRFDAVTRSLDD
ncbi:MAG: hypothetical protein O2892_09105 [Actinomycetota bacterium]|nr:hypothetical protein [Actinomycetota bacterium]MDA2949186.1 hypothetical protein [Actinomycetota bacterium]